MAPRKLDQAKRLGAGWACLGMFHALSMARSMSVGISTTSPVRKDTFGEGLTDKEKEVLRSMEARLYTMSHNYRKLGWHLLGMDKRINT